MSDNVAATTVTERPDFDCMTCSMDELQDEIERFGNHPRADFLRGVEHARIIISAATGGRIA